MRRERFTIDCEPRQAGYVAAYLRVAGDECAFVECYTEHALPHLLAALAGAGKRPEDVRYVIVTHAHLDHAGGASALMTACPNATLLAHPRAARHLIDPEKLIKSATAVYGEEVFRATYGEIRPIPSERVRALEDGEAFELGGDTFSVLHTLGHAKHHFVLCDPALDCVYTGDAFGLAYPALQRAGRFAFPSTSPTDFDGPRARESVRRIATLGLGAACLTHFGEVRDLGTIAEQLDRQLARAEQWFASARDHGKAGAELVDPIVLAQRASLQAEAQAIGLELSPDDWAALDLDVRLNADGIAFAAERARQG